MSDSVPDIVIGRLPLYLRALARLEQDGVPITSSHELGAQLGISSAQIRKDLSHFGEFGKQGTGYQVPYLREQLARILCVDRDWTVAVIGAGHLGRALAGYKGFGPRGFHVDVIFDNDPDIIGTQIGGLVVKPGESMVEELRARRIEIAMIAVPAAAAQSVTDRVVAGGVRAILNYAPIRLVVPDYVHVQDIDPVIHLQHMTYYLRT
ncbi:MAG: redox-sensing transcriptional repressor Rex [Anaerolineae bacterium]|nr:redox-sensing transcriptional repressor Rex [Anaerolineae bacterium]